MRTATTKHKRFPITFAKKGRTKQAHKNESDINLIMAKYVRTGVIEHARKFADNYGFATAVDFHEAMNLISEANQMFDALPSKIRAQFDNEPKRFLAFCEDDENAAKLLEMGVELSKPPWKRDDQVVPEKVEPSPKPPPKEDQPAISMP